MAQSTVTNDYLSSIMGGQDGIGHDFSISSFKISEGGWQLSGASKVSRSPDPTLTDVDVLVNPSRYTGSSQFVFSKLIDATKINVISATEIEVECFVGTGEANDNGLGASPEFFEIGIFDASGDMVVHETFSKQIKDDRRALRHTITIKRVLG